MADIARESAAARSGRYSLLAIVLHWTIAALIVLQVTLSSRMEGPPTPESFAVTQLHKSVGVTVLLLSLLRLGWRLANPPPPLPQTMPAWERTLARLTHVAFYGVMIGMPLTGWIMVSTSRIVLPTLLYGVIPWPMIPGLPDLAPGAKHLWHEIGEQGHGLIIKLAYGLVALHVAGALKHQLFSHDEPVLGRMAPGAVAGRWWEPRLFAIALAAVAVIAFGLVVEPPKPGMAPPPPAAAPAPEPAEAQAPATPAAVPATPAAPAAAAAAPPAGPVPWTVLPGSTLAFTSAWSGTPIQGRFDRWRAQILFSPEALEGSRVSVSIDVGSVKTGDAQRDAELPSADWLDTAGHPRATFTATRFSKTAEGRFVAHGTLTLRGVSKPVDLPFRLTLSGDRAEVRGSAALDRTAFGVGQGEFAATDQIPAKVTVRVDLKARRAAPSAG